MPFIVIIGLIAYMVVTFTVIFPQMDKNDAAAQKIHDAQAQACRNKGGVPIMSEWDGSLKDCQGLTGVKEDK
jgi:hypothetical protein